MNAVPAEIQPDFFIFSFLLFLKCFFSQKYSHISGGLPENVGIFFPFVSIKLDFSIKIVYTKRCFPRKPQKVTFCFPP